ncbi:hypothetical protein D3C77_660050 [compost metagenome]
MFFQTFQCNMFDIRICRVIQRLTNHILFRILKGLLRETHRLRKQLEDLHVALALAQRGNDRLLKLDVVMPVRPVHVRILEG